MPQARITRQSRFPTIPRFTPSTSAPLDSQNKYHCSGAILTAEHPFSPSHWPIGLRAAVHADVRPCLEPKPPRRIHSCTSPPCCTDDTGSSASWYRQRKQRNGTGYCGPREAPIEVSRCLSSRSTFPAYLSLSSLFCILSFCCRTSCPATHHVPYEAHPLTPQQLGDALALYQPAVYSITQRANTLHLAATDRSFSHHTCTLSWQAAASLQLQQFKRHPLHHESTNNIPTGEADERVPELRGAYPQPP